MQGEAHSATRYAEAFRVKQLLENLTSTLQVSVNARPRNQQCLNRRPNRVYAFDVIARKILWQEYDVLTPRGIRHRP